MIKLLDGERVGMTRAINVVAIDWFPWVRLDLLCPTWVGAENIR